MTGITESTIEGQSAQRNFIVELDAHQVTLSILTHEKTWHPGDTAPQLVPFDGMINRDLAAILRTLSMNLDAQPHANILS
jgi:hypothetical protein